jgi:predicted polyphosphate/ATP-dependent NAD kinase
MQTRRDIGLIVNPCAGPGGPAGLRGTDAPEQQAAARELGVESRALARTRHALQALMPMARFLRISTGPGDLGQAALAENFPDAQLCSGPEAALQTAAATRHCVKQMLGRGIELLLFAGGDGTARDILAVARERLPVIGIPCGATMQSGVFAATPAAAGTLALAFLRGECRVLRDQDVLGRGGLAPGATRIEPIAYGRLRVPWDRDLVPGSKLSVPAVAAQLEQVVAAALALMDSDTCILFGPGSTKQAVLARMELTGTLVGVDVILRGKLIAADANEPQLARLLQHHDKARIIITPVGGQGFLFGRGNQPLSARVIRAVGVENISVISTPAKLQALSGRPLRIDLDDADLLRLFPLNVRVVTGPGKSVLHPLAITM